MSDVVQLFWLFIQEPTIVHAAPVIFPSICIKTSIVGNVAVQVPKSRQLAARTILENEPFAGREIHCIVLLSQT